MVVSSSLDDDDGVLNVVLLLGFSNQLHGHLKEAARCSTVWGSMSRFPK